MTYSNTLSNIYQNESLSLLWWLKRPLRVPQVINNAHCLVPPRFYEFHRCDPAGVFSQPAEQWSLYSHQHLYTCRLGLRRQLLQSHVISSCTFITSLRSGVHLPTHRPPRPSPVCCGASPVSRPGLAVPSCTARQPRPWSGWRAPRPSRRTCRAATGPTAASTAELT